LCIFLRIPWNFSKIDQILGHKENLYRCNGIKLETNGKENCKNNSNSKRLNNNVLKDSGSLRNLEKKLINS
jgi:hypothetical protein